MDRGPGGGRHRSWTQSFSRSFLLRGVLGGNENHEERALSRIGGGDEGEKRSFISLFFIPFVRGEDGQWKISGSRVWNMTVVRARVGLSRSRLAGIEGNFYSIKCSETQKGRGNHPNREQKYR